MLAAQLPLVRSVGAPEGNRQLLACLEGVPLARACTVHRGSGRVFSPWELGRVFGTSWFSGSLHCKFESVHGTRSIRKPQQRAFCRSMNI